MPNFAGFNIPTIPSVQLPHVRQPSIQGVTTPALTAAGAPLQSQLAIPGGGLTSTLDPSLQGAAAQNLLNFFGTKTVGEVDADAVASQIFGEGGGLFVRPSIDPATGIRRRALSERLRDIRELEGTRSPDQLAAGGLIPETLQEIQADLANTGGFQEAVEFAIEDSKRAGTFADTEEFRRGIEQEAALRLLAPALLGEREPGFQQIRAELGLEDLPEDIDDMLAVLFGGV